MSRCRCSHALARLLFLLILRSLILDTNRERQGIIAFQTSMITADRNWCTHEVFISKDGLFQQLAILLKGDFFQHGSCVAYNFAERVVPQVVFLKAEHSVLLGRWGHCQTSLVVIISCSRGSIRRLLHQNFYPLFYSIF